MHTTLIGRSFTFPEKPRTLDQPPWPVRRCASPQAKAAGKFVLSETCTGTIPRLGAEKAGHPSRQLSLDVKGMR